MALVAMAFLAVLREGFETSVFLLAALQDASDTAAGAGATIGLIAAIAIGLGIYRGGVRINLTRFFRITGLILVFVAAGLLSTSLHTAHEAGWFNSVQGQAIDLTWLVQPGTISGSLLTGMLGLQPQPTVGEALVYLLYAVPMTLYVLWPAGCALAAASPPERGPAPLRRARPEAGQLRDDTEAMQRFIWVGDEGPAWMRGGSYLVSRRIRMLLEIWDRSSLEDQEQTIGRDKYEGRRWAPRRSPTRSTSRQSRAANR